MRCLQVILMVTINGLLVTSLDTFLDCPGNDDIWGILRRCCPSPELPNGCECFDISDATDFTNTGFHKPECPADLGVEFHLFTRSNREQSVIVKASDNTLTTSPYNPKLPTKFIIHGFTDSGPAPWSMDMSNALLDQGDMNVVIVNWENGVHGINYYQAAANVRSTGAMVAQLIRMMKNEHGASLSVTWEPMWKEIERLENQLVGRITGLDPAGPAFESYSANVRVDATDAMFVDIIHTDAENLMSSGFGTRYSIGHVDFYPNGGQHQPGCPKERGGILSMLDVKGERGTCSHLRCLDFFTNSIHKCQYLPPTGDTLCVMGFHTDPACRGDHYPETSGTPPYC